MTKFFIAPYDPKAWEDPDDQTEKPSSDLQIDVTVYKQQLREKWPQIEFLNPPNTQWLEWNLRIPETGEGFIGALQSNAQIVSLETAFVDFILWHREVIPKSYRLYLFNSSSWNSLELSSDTTEQEVRRFLGYYD